MCGGPKAKDHYTMYTHSVAYWWHKFHYWKVGSFRTNVLPDQGVRIIANIMLDYKSKRTSGSMFLSMSLKFQ